ncbi:MAG: hypothetical protein ABGZ36_05960 [Actinomycetota bacterium]
MATQQRSEENRTDTQRFEGDSVEEVLGRVRSELGADAEIVEANKIRSGGIGGFFAKERFEVIARPRAAAPSTGLPPGIDEAAFDRAAAHVAAARSGMAADPTVELPRPAVSSAAPTDLLGLADAVSSAEAAQAAPPSPRVSGDPHGRPETRHAFEPFVPEEMPRLSTQGGAFNEVLHRIATDAGPEIADAVDRRLGTAPLLDPMARPLNPVGPQARTRATTAAEMFAASDAASAAAAPDVPTTATTDPVADPNGDRAIVPTSDGLPVMTSAASPAVAPISDLVQPADAASDTLDRTARLMSWLERDNLPRSTLMTALRGLPTIPSLPDTTGVVVVVVGQRQQALKLCRAMAKAVTGSSDDVVLASASYKGSAIPEERRIIDLTDAERDRLSWRRRPTPTFVAVEAPTSISPESLRWTRDMVDQLEAHQVIGVVDAGRKTGDVAAWAERIGGVDGLALRNLEETTTPYEVLALEVPVIYLDDVPATAGSWAHVLLEGTSG